MAKEKTKKIRLSIPLSEEVYQKIETDAEVVGVSMATYAAMIIGNHYKTQQISLDYAKNNMVEAFRSVFEEAFKAKGLNFDEIARKNVDETIEESKTALPEFIKQNNEK